MAYRALSPFLLFGLVEILSWGVYSISTLFLLLHVGEGVMKGEAASCLPNQSLALLQFKQSLSQGLQPLLSTWKNESDCCEWEGITCDHTTGFVTGLDFWRLEVQVSDPNSSLFQLSHLQSLDLSGNLVIGAILSRLSELTHLTNIRLSDCNLSGPIPDLFKQLSSLTYLDLSGNGLSGKIPESLLNHPTLQNLDLGSNEFHGSLADPILDSFKNLSSLTYLDLSGNGLSGEIPSSLLNHPTLQHLDLSSNKLYGSLPDPIPESFMQLSSLTYLDLSHNSLTEVPPGILNHPTLQHLDISVNKLYGSFRDFGNEFSPLVHVDLSGNMLAGEIPPSIIRKLPHLEWLDISGNRFNGTIDFSLFQNLRNLSHLDLSRNYWTVEFPKTVYVNHQATIFPRLETLHLISCNIKGEFPGFLQNIKNLSLLYLSDNNISGKVPTWVWRIPKLGILDLSQNKLDGFEEAVTINGSRILDLPLMFGTSLSLYMSNNNIHGKIPSALFCNLLELNYLDLSKNNLTGTIPDCLANLTQLNRLKLSKNQLQGQIPRRIICGSESLYWVELSDNQLTGETTRLLYNCSNNYMWTLDLSNNRLTGSLPDNWNTTFDQLDVLDLSNNQLQGQIPTMLICGYPFLGLVGLNDNQFTGEMTRLLHNCSNNDLRELYLSNNRFTGSLPDNWPKAFDELRVLDLSNNQLQGPIPEEFSNSTTPALQVLNLNDNKLVGRIPRNLSMCRELIVINLGNNELSDVFPFWLGHLDQLRVLALQSNKLHGSISYPISSMNMFSSLLILDISGNQLKGHLPSVLFQHFSSMMRKQTSVSSMGPSALLYTITRMPTLLLTMKGQSQMWKLITILTSIDLSNNLFTGGIPEDIGALKELISLNLSRNSLDGPIPRSFGQLQSMESLDLSHNQLSGSIPEELAHNTFLSTLDLSYNNLQGRIPQGKQFDTFNATSFDGNPGLCGPPLLISCPSTNHGPQGFISHVKEMARDLHWEYLAAGIGYAVGFLTTILPILFIKKVGTWFCVHVDRAFETHINSPTLAWIFCRA